MTSIAILDYGMGNLRSVQKALERVGSGAEITTEPERIRAAEGLILPGVGAFPRAMARVRELGLDELVNERLEAGVPVLGICLGLQLLFTRSSENEGADGLGLLAGEVGPLQAPKLPHIGWNLVTFERESALTEGLGEAAAFYHVHSFACRPTDVADVVGESEYGERFVSVVERDNVMAAQFHPEKSSTDGLLMLKNFAALAAAVVA